MKFKLLFTTLVFIQSLQSGLQPVTFKDAAELIHTIEAKILRLQSAKIENPSKQSLNKVSTYSTAIKTLKSKFLYYPCCEEALEVSAQMHGKFIQAFLQKQEPSNEHNGWLKELRLRESLIKNTLLGICLTEALVP